MYIQMFLKMCFRRHDNCDCIVEYYPGDGKKQNVMDKRMEIRKESDKIEERKLQGLSPESDAIIRNNTGKDNSGTKS